MVVSGYIDGLPVVITDKITKKVRSRTHRKKRIDKKWLKRYGFKEVIDHSKCLVFEDKDLGNKYLLMSQKCYDGISRSLAKMGGKA